VPPALTMRVTRIAGLALTFWLSSAPATDLLRERWTIDLTEIMPRFWCILAFFAPFLRLNLIYLVYENARPKAYNIIEIFSAINDVLQQRGDGDAHNLVKDWIRIGYVSSMCIYAVFKSNTLPLPQASSLLLTYPRSMLSFFRTGPFETGRRSCHFQIFSIPWPI
jgi:hypothetical protein